MHKLLDMQAKLYNFAFMLTSNRDDANDLLQDRLKIGLKPWTAKTSTWTT